MYNISRYGVLTSIGFDWLMRKNICLLGVMGNYLTPHIIKGRSEMYIVCVGVFQHEVMLVRNLLHHIRFGLGECGEQRAAGHFTARTFIKQC